MSHPENTTRWTSRPFRTPDEWLANLDRQEEAARADGDTAMLEAVAFARVIALEEKRRWDDPEMARRRDMRRNRQRPHRRTCQRCRSGHPKNGRKWCDSCLLKERARYRRTVEAERADMGPAAPVPASLAKAKSREGCVGGSGAVEIGAPGGFCAVAA